MTDEDFTGRIALRYNGNPRYSERPGFIPGVTPAQGLQPGEHVEITDALLASLNRPTGDGADAEFAQFIAGVYNANHTPERWTVLLVAVMPEHVESEQPGEPTGEEVPAGDAVADEAGEKPLPNSTEAEETE